MSGLGGTRKAGRFEWMMVGVVIAYAAGAALTFGYGINRTCSGERIVEGMLDGKLSYMRVTPACAFAPADSFAAPFSLAWPAYWLVRGAIEVTKP